MFCLHVTLFDEQLVYVICKYVNFQFWLRVHQLSAIIINALND